ncbi:MAG: hypothetical protein LBL04_05295 [Bacteroidales bacterium]|jgi:hypothetical protein|nr:hypothetical protein [Bacteroidales bacterium]
MKPKNVLKIGFLTVACALLSVGVKAQTPPLPTPSSAFPNAPGYTPYAAGVESIDSVTVGSRMPYKVDPQATVGGLTFQYQWLFSESLPISDYAGAGVTDLGSSYYAENEISVVMDGAVVPAGTLFTVKTNVRSLLGTNVLCAGNEETNSIQVVERPKIDWDASKPKVDCSTSDVTIPLVTLTGYNQIEIAYTIDYYADATKPGSADKTSDKYLILTDKSINLPVSEFPDGAGLYEITVTGITDRISRKSLTPVVGDVPSDPYQVIIYKTPVTNPLQHIKNMP